MSGLSRRQWLAGTAAGAVSLATRSLTADDAYPAVRAVTRGPKFHWFGYYDKFAFSADNRYLLSNQVDFEHRSPSADDVIRVGMIDLQDGDRWTELGECRAWGWQQGCMLQWRPGHTSEGSLERSRRRAVRLPCSRREDREEADASQADLHRQPRWHVGPEPQLLAAGMAPARLRYEGVPDQYRNVRTPSEFGIDRVSDLDTGKSVRARLHCGRREDSAFRRGPGGVLWHWFNHLLINPTASGSSS